MDFTTTDFAWVVDAIVAATIVISAYLAMVRGVFRETLALASWAVALIAGFALGPAMQPVVESVPGLGSLLKNCQYSLIAAFLLVFGLVLLITGVLVWVFSRSIQNTALSLADQVIGFIFGAVRGLVLVAVLYIIYEQIVPPASQLASVDEAATITLVRQSAEMVRGVAPDQVPGWLEARVDQLLGQCDG